MSDIEKIVPHGTYIEVIFTGEIRRGFPDASRNNQMVLDVCSEHNCTRVLEDYTKVDYQLGSDVLGEHRLAEALSSPELRAIKWAQIMAEPNGSGFSLLENVAANRGLRLCSFLDRDEAIAWLLED